MHKLSRGAAVALILIGTIAGAGIIGTVIIGDLTNTAIAKFGENGNAETTGKSLSIELGESLGIKPPG